MRKSLFLGRDQTNRKVGFILFIICLFVSGSFFVWVISNNRYEKAIENTIAMQWGDGKYGKAFYGAHVFLVKMSRGYSVNARVYIGRGDGYFHECGKLGEVQSPEEAVEKWGQITWKPEGLFIGGASENFYFLAREKLEAHR